MSFREIFTKTWGLLFAGIIVGFGVAFFVQKMLVSKEDENKDEFSLSETRAGGYKFINPLLECDDFNSEGEIAISSIRQEIENYIKDAKATGTASHVSVYFRSLNNGAHLGIKSDERYAPASLLKVPYLLLAFKRAQDDPSFLQKKILFNKRQGGIAPNITDTGLVVLGKSYSVEELVYKMIVHSDNDAKDMVVSFFTEADIMQMLADMGLVIPSATNENEIMSVKEYASFFRILYNATYLNRTYSEKALNILSQTTFKGGLLAGVPEGTVVAHKFGERGFLNSNVVQLHDCGIVYVNNNPYLLCVMTRGTDFQQLSRIIANISAIVYRNVSVRKM